MPENKETVKNILESDPFTANALRDLVDERELNVDKRSRDEMIQALLSQEWSSEELASLKSKFQDLQKLKSPLGYYVGEISELPDATDDPVFKELKERLLINEAHREDGELVEQGFEIQEAGSQSVTGIYWTQTETYKIDALDRFQSTTRTYNMGLEFNLDRNIVHIIADNYGKLGELVSELEDKGVVVDGVGHEHKTSDKANELVEAFVNDVSKGLKEAQEQKGLNEFGGDEPSGTNDLIRVDTVHIKLSSGDLKTANLEGRADIFDEPVVKDLTEEKGGRIAQMKGDFTYDGIDFNFNVGYTEKLGRVRIKKKGRKGDVDLVEDVFEFVYDYYDEYFIDI